MVAGLFRSEAGYRRKDTKGITCEHDDVAGLAVDDAWDLGVGDVLNRIGATSVFCDADIVIIRETGCRVVDNVLEDGTELDSVVDIRFLFSREVDALGVASTLNIENTSVRPHMLIITNQQTIGIGRKCGLASTRKTEEQGDITSILADVSGGVKRQLAEFDGLKVML